MTMSSLPHFGLLLFAATSIIISIVHSACSWNIGDYGTVNLAPLQNEGQIVAIRDGNPGFSVVYTACNEGYHCEVNEASGTGMAAQVYTDDYDHCNGVISKYDTQTRPRHEINGNGEDQIVFDYPVVENIYTAGCSQGRQGEFIFICDENAVPYEDVQFYQDGGSDPCYYHTTMRTKYACATGGGGGGDGGESTTSGMSGGWVFIIILICLISVYCIVGYIMGGVKSGDWGNIKKNLPQFMTFWIYVPKLTLAGCITSWEWIRGKVGGSHDADTGDIYEKY
eukprot:CAMPEP_0201597176 /NCGR_PEP_ID=MMETSP0190_2-20130828/193733_1 /ASSEMBLY_ACC=CAM_ASM_000263 /TAXON_ID=37353 /ORGANISM="Rosalina sp." /LENGTH=280 /DNA_ID=CAMNT_0048058009 /DNA_START=10 /DNA_END=852 /DNA_ORIENTATION=+